MRVQVYGGLCNRLRAVLSRLTPDGLTVVWEPNDEIAHGRFLDVFEPLPGVRFDEVAHPTDFKTLEPANGDWWPALARLKPVVDVRERIERAQGLLGGPYDAMHMRRTDHIDYARSTGGFTGDEDFRHFAASTDRPVYLATDNGRTQRRMLDWIGPRLHVPSLIDSEVEHDAGGCGRRFTTLADAVVDLYVCAGAVDFMGSGASSFTDTIHQLRALGSTS